MKRVLSCIQPTGHIHFGNYFGAIKNWVSLQEQYKCIYGVVDYHAMTHVYKHEKLRATSWELIFNLMATGIKHENLFIQSLVPEHAELCWIFNCFTSYGQLTRMTQFKDKSGKQTEADFVSAGLLDYPVLQAADILIYRADYVPIGKDQVQHLELTRNIAQRFNTQLGKEFFVMPEPLLTEIPKVQSTADPLRKMSKSAGEKHFINVFDDESRIRKQIKSAVTDAGDTPSDTMSPGVENLFSLLKASEQFDAHTALTADYESGSLKYSDLKAAVADGLVALNQRFRQNRATINADKKQIKSQIKQSSHEIRKIAQETIKEVKDMCGLMNVRF